MTALSTPSHGPPAPAPARPTRRWCALGLLCVAQFVIVLEVTVVNVGVTVRGLGDAFRAAVVEVAGVAAAAALWLLPAAAPPPADGPVFAHGPPTLPPWTPPTRPAR